MANSRSGSTWVRLVTYLALLVMVSGGILSHSAGAQDSTTLRFAFWGDPAEQAAYQAVIDSFELVHPEINVEADYTPGQSDYYRKISTDFAANDAPDIFLINYRNFGQYAAPGGLLPIEDYLNNSSAFSPEDFYQEPMDAFRYRGGPVTCMPQNISSLVVYYNVDLFEANGIPLPTSGWTWDEFIAAAEALTQDTDGDGTIDQFGVVVEPSFYRMSSFIWSAGGELVDDYDNPTVLTLDTPEAKAGIEAFLSLGVMGSNVVPGEEEVTAEGDQDRFMRGGAGMFLQSRRPVPSLREIEGFTWDVAPLPVINEAATVLHSDAFCIAAGTDTPDEAWTFVEFAVSAEGQTILAATGRTVPSMISVAQSDAFLLGIMPGDAAAAASPAAASPVPVAGGLPPASSQVYLDNIPLLHRLPSVSTWGEVEDAFNAEFDRAFYEPVDIDAAVAAAIANAQPALDRSAEEDAS